MADVSEQSYLSIGEVLGLLLEEFPDVTISKIRFLESQGLISPERTPSGYRKFYDADVELLRVILTEQRQNYLPLRVIKDRLDSGEIDPTGEHLRPSDDDPESSDDDRDSGAPPADGATVPTEDAVPASAIASHPASRHVPVADAPAGGPADGASPDTASSDGAASDETSPASTDSDAGTPPGAAGSEPDAAPLLPGVLLDRDEFLAMVGLTDGELDQLESFGIVTPRPTSGAPIYDEDAVAIATPAREFLRAGIDARHLRNWRTSAEREASLYEQIITPRFRHRNPEARAEALAQLGRLDELGASLRAAMTRQALRHHFDG
jgi:DNA-binding transcriptional MerR regulator